LIIHNFSSTNTNPNNLKAGNKASIANATTDISEAISATNSNWEVLNIFCILQNKGIGFCVVLWNTENHKLWQFNRSLWIFDEKRNCLISSSFQFYDLYLQYFLALTSSIWYFFSELFSKTINGNCKRKMQNDRYTNFEK
jgi:hypothetical protein